MKNKSALWSLLFLGAVLLIIIINTEWVSPDTWLWGAFPATAGLMIVAILAIGIVLNGRPEGLIIDNRNRMSLSKLQMLVWTVVVVSALAASAAYNVHHGFGAKPGDPGPLEITIPTELLFAMGIAAASFVATPTILSLKAQDDPTDDDVTAAQVPAPAPADPTAAPDPAAVAAAQAASPSGLNNSGKVHGRTDPAGARWSDLFSGDEVGNCNSPDLSKIQQFAISLLLVTIYSSQVIALFMGLQISHEKHIPSLPVLGQQFVMLLAISHASYLVYKAAPHTASAPDSGS